jgi:SAM-dependent methyltransferase
MSGLGSDGAGGDTARPEYAERLQGLQEAWWKRALDVQAPYRWFLRRLHLGHTLDVGCGLGRNLANLGGNAVGVDHNPDSIARCRERGFVAYTVEEFRTSPDARPGSYDALLFSHVVEHMHHTDAVQLVEEYLPYLRPVGRVVLITPQERGFASDATHVQFFDREALGSLATRCGLEVERSTSFPFPRFVGRWFTYNEFVVVARAA